MESNFCFNCGAQIDPVSRICPSCGSDNSHGNEGQNTMSDQTYGQQQYGQQLYGQPQYGQPQYEQQAQPYMQQQFGQQMQPPQYNQQAYMGGQAGQAYYGAPYQMPMQPASTKPSVLSIIIGIILLLIGVPLFLLFGIGGLGLLVEGEVGGGLALGFVAVLMGVLCGIGIRQFLPRKPKQPQIMQQPWNYGGPYNGSPYNGSPYNGQQPQNNNWNNYPPM